MLRTIATANEIIFGFSTTITSQHRTTTTATPKRQCRPSHLATIITEHIKQCTKRWERSTLRSKYADRPPHCTRTTKTGRSATPNSRWCSSNNSFRNSSAGQQHYRRLITLHNHHQLEVHFINAHTRWASRILSPCFTMKIIERWGGKGWLVQRKLVGLGARIYYCRSKIIPNLNDVKKVVGMLRALSPFHLNGVCLVYIHINIDDISIEFIRDR